MEKTSKVKQAKYLDKTWANDYGTFHVHGIAFENGDFGEYSSKDPIQEKFVVGVLSTYTKTGDPGRHKIKPVAPESAFNPAGSASHKESSGDRNRGFALSYAKDFINAQINTGTKNLGPADVLLIAEDFNNWLNNENTLDRFPGDPPPSQPIPEIDTRIHNEDVLPF